MEGVDVSTTRRLKKKIARKVTEEDQMAKRKKLQTGAIASSGRYGTIEELDGAGTVEPFSDDGEEFHSPRSVPNSSGKFKAGLD